MAPTRNPDGICFRATVQGTPFTFYILADSFESAARIAEEAKEKGSAIHSIEKMGVIYR